ncbi:hypothetical protein D7Z54_01575 [Salibacterium salarium]|uniref:Uncharacterized protein n=1 Tax=Salibacterium salarium TaxID=284579 RepID=A0A3R9WWV5_9BACI|nr:hypothetical protein [Salibacterium salarium]RSL35281.1 hypothetical protein D7Z54_01575 [Salibacterium salarium]
MNNENEKYMIVAVDQEGNEIGLESYTKHSNTPEIIFDCKNQARLFYDKIKADLFPHSVKLLTIKET